MKYKVLYSSRYTIPSRSFFRSEYLKNYETSDSNFLPKSGLNQPSKLANDQKFKMTANIFTLAYVIKIVSF